MIKQIIVLSVTLFSFFTMGCSDDKITEEKTAEIPTISTAAVTKDTSIQGGIILRVNDTILSISWEDNQSVEALKEILREEPLTITTEQYGGFEQVGKLPQSIVNNDIKITASPGDIVLYSGNSLVLFWGTNTWEYTKLGHINNVSPEELERLLSDNKTILTLYMPE